jgi:hypothetical protein
VNISQKLLDLLPLSLTNNLINKRVKFDRLSFNNHVSDGFINCKEKILWIKIWKCGRMSWWYIDVLG